MRNVAVAALTKNLADELGPWGITATVVHPGFLLTDMATRDLERRAQASASDASDILQQIADRTSRLPTADCRRGRGRRHLPLLVPKRRDHRRRDRGRRWPERTDLLLTRFAEELAVRRSILGERTPTPRCCSCSE